MKKIAIPLLLLLLFNHCRSQRESIDYGFWAYDWTMSIFNHFGNLETDSTTIPYAVFLETRRNMKGSISCLLPLFQARSTQPEITINIHYKTENVDELYLKLVAFGECERVLSINTLHLPPSAEWTISIQSVPMKNAMFLELFIEMTRDTLVLDGTNKNARIGIKELDVFVDGRRIDQFATARRGTRLLLREQDIIPFDSNNLSHLPFMNKKILAIGETVHGTETFNKLAVDIIKERILYHNCRLILLELPLEISFYINRYIASASNFKIETISSYFDNTLFCSSIFVSLIEWVREFNLSSKEKIYFFGVDTWGFTHIDRYVNLFNFFYAINQTVNSKKIEKICNLLLRFGGAIDELILLFDTNQYFENILTKEEFSLLRHTLQQLYMIRHYPAKCREKNMYKNARLLIENLLKEGQTVTIFAHFGHTNYQASQGRMTYMKCKQSFGHHMRSRYGKDYSCIALIAEEGSFLTSNPNHTGFKIEKLHSSPIGSLEYLIGRLSFDIGYVPIERFTCSDALQVRFIGNAPLERQFRFMFPKVRMDGVIFVRHVSAIQKNEKLMNREVCLHLLMWERWRQAVIRMDWDAPPPPFI